MSEQKEKKEELVAVKMGRITATEEESVSVVSHWSKETGISWDWLMYFNKKGDWKMNPAYESMPFPSGTNTRTFVAIWLDQRVAYRRYEKYLLATDDSIMAICSEFDPRSIVRDTSCEIAFCLFHACLSILPNRIRQQVFTLRDIRQSGHALDIDMTYNYGSMDFIHAKNWLLGDARIPEAIEETGIDPNIVFQAIEADLIDWRAPLCSGHDAVRRLDKVHDDMEALMRDKVFDGLPKVDVFGEHARAIRKLKG